MFLKSVVLFLKISLCLLLSRPLGSIILDVAQKYEQIYKTIDPPDILL